jgi:hypothetical protein
MAHLLSSMINNAAARRATRENRKLLERELAGFSTRIQRLEIETIMGYYPDEQTKEMREILARQATRLF